MPKRTGFAAAPELETARLKLRAHRDSDLDECFKMWADPEVTRFIGGKPSTLQQTWARILAYTGHWKLLGFGYWAVEEKATGRFVGELGFADFKREMEPPLNGVPELGWALAPWAHGQGFATEALQSAIAWGDLAFGGTKTACIIDPGNVASIRVAEKCGYQKVRDGTYAGKPTILFERIP